MKIQNMFQKDINRDINGVIKVSQNDDTSLRQELSEYIITKELAGISRLSLITILKLSTIPQIKLACGFPASSEVVNHTS